MISPRYCNRPLSIQCFMHCNASKRPFERALRSTVIVLREEEKTLSISADIAGIERISNAHWRKLGTGYCAHQSKRFCSFHLTNLVWGSSTYRSNSSAAAVDECWLPARNILKAERSSSEGSSGKIWLYSFFQMLLFFSIIEGIYSAALPVHRSTKYRLRRQGFRRAAAAYISCASSVNLLYFYNFS